jgi:drug/metabolite transporter (DMT)-like permease
MSLWVLLSIAAAAFQTLRFMLQKKLATRTLSASGATFARFAYSAPLVAVAAAAWVQVTGAEIAIRHPVFWAYALGGGLAQILATWCVVALFARRNFAVGITFKKTEVVLTALVGLAVLGDAISLQGLGAIMLGLLGVLILSDVPVGEGLRIRRLMNPAAGLGLLSGVFFAFSAVAYRGATLEIAHDAALTRAIVTLSVVTASQAIGMALWLRLFEPGQLSAVARAWRGGVPMGVTSLGGSLCWFTAFTLQSAAYVFAVGQIEVIFSILVSVLVFGEAISRREYAGIAILTASILLIAFF